MLQIPVRMSPMRRSSHGISTVPKRPVTTPMPRIPAIKASEYVWLLSHEMKVPSKLSTVRYRSEMAREEGNTGEVIKSRQSDAVWRSMGPV